MTYQLVLFVYIHKHDILKVDLAHPTAGIKVAWRFGPQILPPQIVHPYFASAET